MLDNQLYYPTFALLMLTLVILLVPRRQIKKLFWFSLLWGSTVDSLLILVFRGLNLYYYENLGPFNFLGVPMWIALAWAPAIILLIYFYPERDESYYQYFYIGAFSMIGVGIGVFFTQAGLLQEVHWNEFFRFPFHFIWFYGALRHYQYLQATEKS